jgi:hypothetical protein
MMAGDLFALLLFGHDDLPSLANIRVTLGVVMAAQHRSTSHRVSEWRDDRLSSLMVLGAPRCPCVRM